MISKYIIQAVKAVPVLDVIGKYVSLLRRGSNYVGLCPFHDEYTPSFVVNPAKGIYKCFGCGAGGDVLEFVMQYDKKNLGEAVELITGLSGIIIDTDQKTEWTGKTPAKEKKKSLQPAPFDTIPLSFLDSSTSNIAGNPLTAYIAAIVGEDVMEDVVSQYKIKLDGTWITYPQIDRNGKYRTGKLVCYGNDGHRSDIIPKWVHHELKRTGKLCENFNLKQCFTGEHLTSQSSKPIAIVEGQSTMLFMAALGKAALKYNIYELKYFASLTWICTGGSDGIGWKDEQVMQALKGKAVVLFPDAGFYDQWLSDAEQMQEHGIKVQVSQLIESKYAAGQLKYNKDLRDYFMFYANEIKELCHKEPLHFSSKDILSYAEHPTTNEFKCINSLYLKLQNGNGIDIFFDESGEPIKPGEQSEAVNNLARNFNKKLQLAMFDNSPCWVHIDNRFNETTTKKPEA